MNGMRPIHPGEILKNELDKLKLSANALAKVLDARQPDHGHPQRAARHYR